MNTNTTIADARDQLLRDASDRVSSTVIDIHTALGNDFDYGELMSKGLDDG